MLIGVLSDTHGRVDTTSAALTLLQQRKVRQYIHCGDVGGERILDLLAGLPAAFVWGNCDYDQNALAHYAAIIGVRCFGAIGQMTLDGKVVGFIHGDDRRRFQQTLDSQQCDMLFYGHSHVRGVSEVGKTLVVNPGALHRVSTKTVAVVDTANRQVDFLEVE